MRPEFISQYFKTKVPSSNGGYVMTILVHVDCFCFVGVRKTSWL